jgi:Cu2+-exporting ATPase
MQAAIDQRLCRHCGAPFRPTAQRADFCCAGCQFVHGLITQNGLGQFYDLQEGGLPPAPALVFQRRDYAWLEELARLGDGPLVLDVQGISCIGCAWLIEKVFQRQPGALAIHVDPTLGRLSVRGQAGVFDPVVFARELQSFGYLVGPPAEQPAPASRALHLRLGLCAALALNTMLFTLPRYLGMSEDFQFAPLFHRLTLILGTLSFFIGGSYFFVRAWRALRQGVLHIDLPISVGLVAAYAGSVVAWVRGAPDFVYFDFVATFAFLMLAGRWLQQKAVERNRHQLLAAQATPPTVRLASGEKVSATQIKAGDGFTVEPGGMVPVRARLQSAAATLGLEWINGESEAASVPHGELVTAGATNCGQAAITLEAREPWANSLLARLLQIAPTGTARDAALERFLRGYIAVVLVLAALGFCSWWVVTGALLPALQVFISVLVVSCPCASGVALPLCRDLAATQLRRFGVFIRDGDIWSKLDHVRKIIFDKTGTLTLETISLLNPEALHALSPDARAALLTMVRDNLHPVSGCLREQLLADGVMPIPDGEARETIGFGLEMTHGGARWRLGRATWATEHNGQLGGDCVFARDGQLLAAFHLGEAARGDAREEIAALRATGCEVFILSGDRQVKVDAMADRLHLPHQSCTGELTPDEKADRVQAINTQDTLYLGDGANDSLAFDRALLGGTPAIDRGLLEQKAAFYFLGRSLAGVGALLAMAARRRRTARAVVTFAIAYNVVAVALCLSGLMSPLLASILMPASSLVSLSIVLAGFHGRRPVL